MTRHLSNSLAVLTLGLTLSVSVPGLAQPAPTTAGTAAPAPGAAAATTQSATPSGEMSADERAMALFRKGIEAHKQGNWPEAESYYRSAFELKRSYDIAGNLGDVELKLNKPRDAAEHLAFTIRNFPLTGKPELRERMQKTLTEARVQVGAVKVAVNVDRADIYVDGQRIGQAPMTEEYFVTPGPHTIEARLKGYQSARQGIQAEKGAQQDVRLSLLPIKPPPPEKRSKVPAIVLGGVAVAGLGAGVGLFLASNAQLKKGEELTTVIKNEGGHCNANPPAVNHPSCDDLAGKKSTINTLDGLAIGALSLGGLAAVSMVVYLALPAPGPRTTTTGLTVKVQPTAGRDNGGLLVSGSF